MTLAGFGKAAAFAELLGLTIKEHHPHWNTDIYAFNSPYVFDEKDGIPQLIKALGPDHYFPIRACMPSCLEPTYDHKSEFWLH